MPTNEELIQQIQDLSDRIPERFEEIEAATRERCAKGVIEIIRGWINEPSMVPNCPHIQEDGAVWFTSKDDTQMCSACLAAAIREGEK